MKRILNHIPTRNLAVVAVLLAAVGRAASTQEATGNLEGRVASVDGAGLASVTVTASGPSLQRPRQMSTDERGYFRMLALPVGEYTVRVVASSFDPHLQ